MHSRAPLAVLAGILILAASAAVILVVESRDDSAGAAREQEFQQLVGGLGFGPAVDLSRCPASFDPRLGHHCPEDVGRVPAGGYFCPHHACSIFYYPPLEPSDDPAER
jgi:hypothetical protein